MNSQPSVDTAPLPAQRIEFATWCRMTVQEFEKARGYTVKVSQAFNRMYAEGFSPSLAASELWRMSIGL